MFREILKTDFTTFLEIIKNPAPFVTEKFSIVLSNTQIYLSVGAIMLFALGLLIDALKPKNQLREIDLPDNEKGLKDIGSNSVIQKIDLAYAYISMEKISLAKKIIKRLEKKSLSGTEKRELTILKKKLNDD